MTTYLDLFYRVCEAQAAPLGAIQLSPCFVSYKFFHNFGLQTMQLVVSSPATGWDIALTV